MLTYGDGVSDVNIRDLVEFHKSHGKLATVTTVRPISRFGTLDLASERPSAQILGETRQRRLDQRGLFRLRSQSVRLSRTATIASSSANRWSGLPPKASSWPTGIDGFFYAMDTYREYQYLNEMWSSGNAPWKVW